MRLEDRIQKRARPFAILLWFLAFMSPVYVQGRGFVYDQRVVWEILSSSAIYSFVTMVWPSLILHITIYSLLMASLRNRRYTRYFVLMAGFEYLLIGIGQSISIIDGRLEALLSNLILIILLGILWLRDGTDPAEYRGRGPWWFLPLGLFAFVTPAGATTSAVPPWFWMWKLASTQPLYAIPALLADAMAGFGAVAYCLFTPLAITVAGREGVLRPLTVRLTSTLGVAFSSIIIGSSIVGILSGAIPAASQLGVAWNAILHLPLLVTCSYYLAVGWEGR